MPACLLRDEANASSATLAGFPSQGENPLITQNEKDCSERELATLESDTG